jgi:hypothetical protein
MISENVSSDTLAKSTPSTSAPNVGWSSLIVSVLKSWSWTADAMSGRISEESKLTSDIGGLGGNTKEGEIVAFHSRDNEALFKQMTGP